MAWSSERLDHQTAFVAMAQPDVAGTAEADLWEDPSVANVIRAMSLVPDAVRDLKERITYCSI